MSQSEDNCYLSSSSADEKCTCSSSFALKPSQVDVTSRMDACPKPREPPETDSKMTLTLKSNKSNAQESSKFQMDLKNVGKNNPVGSKINVSNEFCGKVFHKELRCLEDGEVVEKNESNVDLEEGEIKDIANEKSVDTYNCRYYQTGSCVYGKDCRFFHTSDKGLYNMFDFPVTAKSYPSSQINQPSQFVPKQKSTFVLPTLEEKSTFVLPALEESETEWDRALKAAIDRIELKKKLSSRRENLRTTIQAIDEKFIRKHSPLKNRYSQRSMRNSCSNRKTIYDIASSKPKSSAKNSLYYRYSLFRRSKTPKDMRWSPKSSSSSRSRSRSRSSSERPSRSCSSTPSPKRGRRFRASSSYLKRHASQSSESSPMRSLSRKKSRHMKRKLQEGIFLYKSCKLSDRRSPVKRLLPGRHENESSRLSRRDAPRRAIQSKHQITGKSTTLCTKTYARNCSDMSISPLSDASNRNYDLPEDRIFARSSHRHATDMSISPIPDVSSSRFSSNQVNGSVKKIVYKSPSKSKVEKLKVDTVQIGSVNDRDPRKKSCRIRSLRSSNNVSSNSTSGKLVKNNPLLMDLMKFYRKESFEQAKCVSKTHVKTTATELADKPANFRGLNEVKQKSALLMNPTKFSRKESLEQAKCVSKTHVKTRATELADKPANFRGLKEVKQKSALLMDLMKFYKKGSFEQTKCVSKTHVKTTATELADKPANSRELNDVKQKSDAIQTNRSKKELLLKRLEQVNAALERKKLYYAGKNRQEAFNDLLITTTTTKS